MGELAREMLDAAPDGDQAEVVTTEGSVFAVRGEAWTIAVVAGRQPLASLMFYDLRKVVRDLGWGSGGGGAGAARGGGGRRGGGARGAAGRAAGAAAGG